MAFRVYGWLESRFNGDDEDGGSWNCATAGSAGGRMRAATNTPRW